MALRSAGWMGLSSVARGQEHSRVLSASSQQSEHTMVVASEHTMVAASAMLISALFAALMTSGN